MSKWYGSIDNRLEEGKNFTGREIRVGDDITMYLWSDRHCYYVTEVIDQKHIKVKPYHVCADKSKPGGMGHQDWLYFKTLKERDDYLGWGNDSEEYYEINDREETWAFRYNKWMREWTIREDSQDFLGRDFCTDKELAALDKKGYYKTYGNLSGKVSFGVRDYYHDWEF